MNQQGIFFQLVVVAMLSGVLTIIAPCILSLLPIMLGSSLSGSSRWRPLVVVSGMIASFAGFGFVFAASTTFLGVSRETLRNLATVLIFVFGLALVFPVVYDRFVAMVTGWWSRVRPSRPNTVPVQREGLTGAFALGASMGVAWVPCAGPVLGIILTIATVERNLLGGTILFLAYALGAGIPMLIIGYGGKWVVTKVRWLATKAELVRRISGALLVLMAVAMFFGWDRQIQIAAFSVFTDTTAIEERFLDMTFSHDQMDDMNTNAVNPADFMPTLPPR
jgi:cytochrome c-type biogenesis protein